MVLALAAAGCGGDDDEGGGGGGGGGGSLSIEISEPQHELWGQNTAETSGSEVLNALFAGLIDYNDKNEPVERLAESVESTDNKLWTIKLKDGYTFHNGEKVTAQSFADAWNFGANQTNAQESNPFFSRIAGYDALNPGEGKTPTTDKMTGLKVVDDTTLEVSLAQPFSQFKTILGYNAFYPLPKAFFDAADKKAWGDAPIGNGPFQMDGKWEHNRQVKVKRYDDFKGGKAKVESITYKIYEDLETAWNDLRAGNLDIMDQLPPSALASYKQELGDRAIDQESSGVGYVGFPMATNPAFAKADLRKAISLAIDREAITKTVFAGSRVPADAYINPIVPGHRPGICADCKLDVARAKQLYAASGGLPGNRMELGYNADGAHKEWMTAVANQLKQNLGITVTLKPFPQFAKILTDLGDKKYLGAFRMAWIMDYPAAENYLKPIFGTAAIENGSNYGGYSNKAFDDFINQGDTAPTPEEGLKFYQQAEDILIKDMPYIPVYFYRTNAAHSDKVKNVKIDAFDRIDVMNVETT